MATFQTVDAEGVAHTITTRTPEYDDGVEILLLLTEVLGVPAAEIVSAAFDKGEFGAAVATLPRLLREAGGPAFVRRLCGYCSRSMIDPTGTEQTHDLRHRATFDTAFRGNLYESFEVAAGFVRAEYAPFLTGVLRRFGVHSTGTIADGIAALIARATAADSENPTGGN